MITLVEARNFRCLRYISQLMDEFHVLVGPNGSGMTTFLDAIAFLGDLASDGVEKAVGERTTDFQDLTWKREGDSFELAIEARVPQVLREEFNDSRFDTVRYEVSVGLDKQSQELQIRQESTLLKVAAPQPRPGACRFPDARRIPHSILAGKECRGVQIAGIKTTGTGCRMRSAGRSGESVHLDPINLGALRSTGPSLLEDESKLPVGRWLKSFLTEGIHPLSLNSLSLRRASRPGQDLGLRADGSNLPWVIADLERNAPERFREWMAHVQTALPDLESIRIIERLDDQHRYLMLRYRDGFESPSWMVSDGTLQLLALTLLAYLSDISGTYLIEGPENGIHPRAIETMFQSLSSVYDAQILLATHSPVVLSLAEPEQLLCFAKTLDGATDIVPGTDHPALAEQQGEVNLSILFASGALGYGG